MRQYYVWISFLHEHRYMIWQHEIMHLVALFCLFRPIFWYVTCLQMSMCFNTHELVYGLLFYIPCFIMIFGIRHWYILAYLCMYLYWLGTFIIYVHFDKCKCTIWLWIETILNMIFLIDPLLLFDIVKGGEIWMHKLRMNS